MLELVFIGMLFYLGTSSDPAPTSALFDSNAWKNAAEAACVGEDNSRLGAITELEAILPQLSNNTLVELTLGEPDSIELTDQGEIWTYCLGYNVIDFDSYIIRFDAFDNVVETRYVQG